MPSWLTSTIGKLAVATREEAEAAVYDAIISAAESAKQQKEGTLLETVSRAFANVAHGAQGGHRAVVETTTYKGETDYRYTSHNRQETNYHETKHQGEARERPPAGFAGSDKRPGEDTEELGTM